MGVSSRGGAHFQRDCNAPQEHRQAMVRQRQTEQVHGPRMRAKERVKRTRQNPNGKSKGTKGAIWLHKGKTSKTGLSGPG